MIDTRVRDSERGFTLVELAIVMMIIGLLIGGILKGQELMMNARLTSTIAAAKGFDAATTTFRDSYNAWPGDMANATNRLPNCNAGLNCVDGGTTVGVGGDGLVGTAGNVGVSPGAQTDEQVQFWRHLLAADLITGIDTSATLAWGQALPSAPIGGGWRIGQHGGGALPAGNAAGNARNGHYLELAGAPATNAAAAVAGTLPLTPARAAQLDRKMDDGVESSGGVHGYGPATCFNAGNPSGYDEAQEVGDCGVFIRIQG